MLCLPRRDHCKRPCFSTAQAARPRINWLNDLSSVELIVMGRVLFQLVTCFAFANKMVTPRSIASGILHV